MKVHCFTSFTFSYLGRAMILVQTLRAAHPDWVIWTVMVDEPIDGDDFGLAKQFDHVVYAKDLGIPDFRKWLFKHDIVEASTAVKGKMLQHMLQQGADNVVYLDPDIAVFSSLHGIVGRLDNHSIVLTPHQVEPNEAIGLMRDNELTSLKYGIFNLGFVAIANDEVGRRFADWWAAQLAFACYDETENGLFTDQKWCDLVPALFDRVYVERDPGYNVASWNLSKRKISITRNGDILVNGSPLKFFHFTKINTAGDVMIEKNAADNTEVMEIWAWYKRALAGNTIAGIPKGYWHYGMFSNGSTIPKSVRVFFRRRADLMNYFEDPFSVNGNSYFEWIRREDPALLQ
jgi:lipopolysaccharide biosynthesis glycosyltransferase